MVTIPVDRVNFAQCPFSAAHTAHKAIIFSDILEAGMKFDVTQSNTDASL